MGQILLGAADRSLTRSIGVRSHVVIVRAAMYEAKRLGRNRVVFD
jgi:hypothetical protein